MFGGKVFIEKDYPNLIFAKDGEEYIIAGKKVLVIGNEGNGLSKSVSESCDYLAKIPMYGKINSLNASVAAGIMIYEVISLDK